jgi:hypothetical protein
MSFPVRWDKPHFKEPVSKKVIRGLKRKGLKDTEDANKRIVRRRDKFCRFPLCACKRFNLALHVAHAEQHKGMGGDPAGKRSLPTGMILLCSARHKENAVALDRGTLRIRPLTNEQYAGPCAFEVDSCALRPRSKKGHWIEVARETTLHIFALFTQEQRAILTTLAEMML